MSNSSDPVEIICDVIIIGSGIAGLTTGWKLANHNLNVLIITKRERAESNTNYAQGGIASVVSSTDSFESHIKDTLIAGDGLCDENIVRFVVETGPALVQELINIGIHFNKNQDGMLNLGKEGGHSHRRILHAYDRTGFEIERRLLQYCEDFPNLRILENTIAIDLIMNPSSSSILGVYALNGVNKKKLIIKGKYTILASGGVGKVFQITSNPDIATGDGIAMAYRAGASIANMEFTQFHPTCLYNAQNPSQTFLLSEALRGEGAILVNVEGHRFMPKYDSREELAPRDIVARAIDIELKKTNAPYVYLDISHKPEKHITSRFPEIYKTLSQFGFDLTKEPIPVAPAAHYICGGVLTNRYGQTDLNNLYCIGEASCTGLHGANRLASNSLLEALVFADATSLDILEKFTNNVWFTPEALHDAWPNIKEKKNRLKSNTNYNIINELKSKIQRIMTQDVGIVRNTKQLSHALQSIQTIQQKLSILFSSSEMNVDVIEIRNLAGIAELIILSALSRKESRGIHYNLDFPDKQPFPKPTILKLTKNKKKLSKVNMINF